MHKLKRNREIILKTMMRQIRRDLFHVSTTLPNTFKIAFNVNIFLIHILVKAKNSRQTDRYVKRNRFSIQFRLEIIILTKTRHNFTDSWHKNWWLKWLNWVKMKTEKKKLYNFLQSTILLCRVYARCACTCWNGMSNHMENYNGWMRFQINMSIKMSDIWLWAFRN